MSLRAALTTDVLKRLERLSLVARRTFRGTGAGERRALRAGTSPDFRDHRLYSPGDDLRHLDWTLLARLDRLYLRRFHDEQDVWVHVVVDASASMGFGSPPKVMLARNAAAALAHLSLVSRDRVTLHVLGGARPARVDLPRGRRGTLRALEELEPLRATGSVDLEAALSGVARELRRPGIVIVLSDLLSPTAAAGLRAFAGGRHQIHALRIVSPEDIDPELEGDLLLVDSETGAEVEATLTPRLRQIYRESWAAHEAGLQAACRKAGASLVTATSDLPLETVVFHRLQAQGWLA